MADTTTSTLSKVLQDIKKSPLQTVHNWQNSRITWLIMLGTALFLELCALYFQYVMKLDPCEKCVYQRLAVMILVIAPALMMISPKQMSLRLAGYGIWIAGAVYGLKEALGQLADYGEFNPFTSSCSLKPTFPFDLPLYDWWPGMFMPTGLCGADDWRFLSLNMAEWMVVIFSIYLAAAAVCVVSWIYCAFFKEA
ncbi:disulfide bond formation protein B [uncultured Endozoicomonas sp.]|uniref:disulfide bond formation protein B n=1 Tax=uncultured Endozoicomonas sp. TaxID=432652 RepID=UPI002612F7E1|nr:disulfide bond formation protein B [uncultured Endozoicomonas sp.]